MPRISAPFTITAWDPAPADQTPWAGAAAPALGRVTIRKTYTGALDGEATADMLTCIADPADYARGAVYTALEQFTGRLDGRDGAFVFQHGAVSGGGPAATDPAETGLAGTDPAGAVAPNSGTGALAGIRGTVSIQQGPDGHTLTLDYTLP